MLHGCRQFFFYNVRFIPKKSVILFTCFTFAFFSKAKDSSNIASNKQAETSKTSKSLWLWQIGLYNVIQWKQQWEASLFAS